MNSNADKSNNFLNVWGDLATKLENLPVVILKCSMSNLEGLNGTIISETSKMLHIQTKDKTLLVHKEGSIFKITLNNTEYIVNGDLLKGLPESRVKKKLISW